MNNFNEIDCLINKILAELQCLKSNRLKALRMQDFNIDVIKKPLKKEDSTTQKSNSNSKSILNSNKDLTVANSLNITFNEKINLSPWKLRRRAKKIYKFQNTIEKGYISGVEKSIRTVENLYHEYLKGNL